MGRRGDASLWCEAATVCAGAETVHTNAHAVYLLCACIEVRGASAVVSYREGGEWRSAHGGGSGGWRSLFFIQNDR